MRSLLIVGCGDVARRALPRLSESFRVTALARAPAAALSALSVTPVRGDLDAPETLAALAGAGESVLHSAPPQESGRRDLRTRNLLAALGSGGPPGRAMVPQRIVYLSTSAVYGDCRGAEVDETRPLNPQSERAQRRVDAEERLTQWCAERGVRLVILRVPGIYAADRLPLERLRAGLPALVAEEDVYSNHVHADDLAQIVCEALARDDVQGVFNASDDSQIRMADYFDLVADRHGLARPPRLPRREALARLSPMAASFMSESRRLSNRRMKEVLGIRLRYPTVFDGVPRMPVAA